MLPICQSMQPKDAVAMLSIYQEGIDIGHATFTSSAGTWEEWDQIYMKSCRIIARTDE